MYKQKTTKRQQETFAAIGAIFSEIKTFFTDVDVSLTQTNTAHYQAKFDALMERAQQVMQPEKFREFQASNYKRWEKKKTAVKAQTSPVQGTPTPQATLYVPVGKQAANGAEISSATDNQDFMQTIENLRVIIAEQQKIIDAERMISATLQKELLKH